VEPVVGFEPGLDFPRLLIVVGLALVLVLAVVAFIVRARRVENSVRG
jgi:hypothetical protein